MRHRNDSSWYREPSDSTQQVAVRLNAVIDRGRSRYQQIDRVQAVRYARMLFLDQRIASFEKDEFCRHQKPVRPALRNRPAIAAIHFNLPSRLVPAYDTLRDVITFSPPPHRTCRHPFCR